MEAHYQDVAKRVVQSKHSPIVVINNSILVKRWATVARPGQVSKSFSPSEKLNWHHFFCSYTHTSGSDGLISFSDIRDLMGMSDTTSETTQLSNLLREWREKGIVSQAKKRAWWEFPKSQEQKKEPG